MSCHDLTKPNDRHVLLVECHEDATDAIAHLLRASGYVVVVAKTCADALESGASRNFDLYLIETDLPDGNGCDLLRQLRELNAVPAIALIGDPEKEKIDLCRLAGFANYLIKPVLGDRLEEVLKQTFAVALPHPTPA